MEKMKIMITRWIILLWSCMTYLNISAQDPEFSQFYVVPQYMNPAMIGFSESPRFSLLARDQMVSFGHAYLTTSLNYDQHFYKIRSSLGAGLIADLAGDIMNTYQLSGYYAYQLDVSDNFHINAGLGLGYLMQHLKTGEALFTSGLNANGPNQYGWVPDAVSLDRTTLHRIDASAGVIGYSQRFFVGFSAKHLTTPSLDFTTAGTDDNKLPMQFSGQIGGTFYLGREFENEDRFYVTPNVLLVNQGSFFQTNAGFYAGKRILFSGLWFRHTLANADALIILAGIKAKMFKIGYSYDFTISGLKTRAGAHELSMTFDFGYNDNSALRQRQRKSYECPIMFRP